MVIDRVLAIHTPITDRGRAVCGGCGNWPCQTLVIATNGSLNSLAQLVEMHSPDKGPGVPDIGVMGHQPGLRCRECRTQAWPCPTSRALGESNSEQRATAAAPIDAPLGGPSPW